MVHPREIRRYLRDLGELVGAFWLRDGAWLVVAQTSQTSIASGVSQKFEGNDLFRSTTQIPNRIAPLFIERDRAQYRSDREVEGLSRILDT